jgi:hypothetical protein
MKIKGEDILFAILIALTCLGLLTSCEYDQLMIQLFMNGILMRIMILTPKP